MHFSQIQVFAEITYLQTGVAIAWVTTMTQKKASPNLPLRFIGLELAYTIFRESVVWWLYHLVKVENAATQIRKPEGRNNIPASVKRVKGFFIKVPVFWFLIADGRFPKLFQGSSHLCFNSFDRDIKRTGYFAVP